MPILNYINYCNCCSLFDKFMDTHSTLFHSYLGCSYYYYSGFFFLSKSALIIPFPYSVTYNSAISLTLFPPLYLASG